MRRVLIAVGVFLLVLATSSALASKWRGLVATNFALVSIEAAASATCVPATEPAEKKVLPEKEAIGPENPTLEIVVLGMEGCPPCVLMESAVRQLQEIGYAARYIDRADSSAGGPEWERRIQPAAGYPRLTTFPRSAIVIDGRIVSVSGRPKTASQLEAWARREVKK